MSRNPLLRLILCLPAIYLLGGCKTPPPGAEGSIAWVEIMGHSRFEVAQATVKVLTKKGFHQTFGADDNMTFERPGSAFDEITQGGFGSDTSLRLRVFINAPENGSSLVHGRAFSVRNAGDRIFEDASEYSQFRRKPVQKLLDEIKASLESQPQNTEGHP
jgi:hypothetical protein